MTDWKMKKSCDVTHTLASAQPRAPHGSPMLGTSPAEQGSLHPGSLQVLLCPSPEEQQQGLWLAGQCCSVWNNQGSAADISGLLPAAACTAVVVSLLPSFPQ